VNARKLRVKRKKADVKRKEISSGEAEREGGGSAEGALSQFSILNSVFCVLRFPLRVS